MFRPLFSSTQILILVSLLAGCSETGPPSTDTASTTIPNLADRISFLETYVPINRIYTQLEFHINFKNNSGGILPGPSDWDVQVVAEVPPEQIPLWIEDSMEPTEAGGWVSAIAKDIDVSGVDRWLRAGGKVVGIDEENAIVVYRLNTYGE